MSDDQMDAVIRQRDLYRTRMNEAVAQVGKLNGEVARLRADLQQARDGAPTCKLHVADHGDRTCCEVDAELADARAQLEAIDEEKAPTRAADRALGMTIAGIEVPLDEAERRLQNNELEWPVWLEAMREVVAERDALRKRVADFLTTSTSG